MWWTANARQDSPLNVVLIAAGDSSATIDGEADAGDEIVRKQECDRLGDVLRFTGTLQQRAGDRAVSFVGRQTVGQ